MKMYLFLLISSFFLTNVFANEKVNCSQLAINIDSIIKEVILLKENPIIPSTSEKLAQFCNLTTPLSRTVSKYAPCQQAYPQQITNMFANDVKNPINYICKTNREESMAQYGCINDNFIANARQITEKLVYSLTKLKSSDSSEIVPRICCSFAEVLQSMKSLNVSFSADCEKKNVPNWFTSRFESAMAESIDLVCGELKTVEKCDNENYAIMQIVREIPPTNFDSSKYQILSLLFDGLAKISG